MPKRRSILPHSTSLRACFCLRGGCDEVGDAERAPLGPEPAEGEGALEFALCVAAVAAGAWAEEAESIGVDGLGDAVFFKGAAEVAEVVPGGVGGDETPCDVDAGMVIDGEEENLLLRGGPPLVNGALVLPKLADVGPAKTALRANEGRRSREEVGKVCFEKSLHAGAGTDKAEETLELIGHELKIGRASQRHKLLKKGEDIVGAPSQAAPPRPTQTKRLFQGVSVTPSRPRAERSFAAETTGALTGR